MPYSSPNIFDRALVHRRLDRAWARAADGADFLLARAAEELAERLSLVKRRFALAADFGSPGPHAAAALAAGGQADGVVRIAPTLASLGARKFLGAVGDLERLPTGDGRFDLAVSLLAMQTVNDLPGALIQMRRALKPDGLLMAAMLGGDTLTELRQSFTIAESEILGGASPRVAPFVDVRAFGSLAQRAGLALPVVDLDRATVRYADVFALMTDLRAFGGANALHARSRKPLRRDVFARVGEVYAERFADPDGRLRATFDFVWLSGWAPHESQPKPLEPGSATHRTRRSAENAPLTPARREDRFGSCPRKSLRLTTDGLLLRPNGLATPSGVMVWATISRTSRYPGSACTIGCQRITKIAKVCPTRTPRGGDLRPMNVSLTPALEEYVRRKVAIGLYNNASEVVREALRLMVERETGGRPAPKKGEVIATLKALEPELRERGVASAAVFGSVVRGQAWPDSDVDVLIDIDPAAPFDLLDLVGIGNLLTDRLGRPVDVVDRKALKPQLRDNILAEAERVF